MVQAARPGAARALSAHEAAGRKQDAALVAGLRGKLLRVNMPLSPRLHRKLNVWTYLPPGYAKAKARLPVVYVLHGMPGEVRDTFVNARVHRVAEQLILAHQIKPLILIGWDGAGPGGPADVTDFLNRADGKWPMEDFIVHELVPWVDRTYRTIPAPWARALDGYSAGGYAAMNLGFKHPAVFNVLSSHSGFFNPNDDRAAIVKILGWPGPLWRENNPLQRVRQLPPGIPLHVFMDIGHNDLLLGEFKQFAAALQARGIDHAAKFLPSGHNWTILNRQFHDSLRFADARFRKGARNRVTVP